MRLLAAPLFVLALAAAACGRGDEPRRAEAGAVATAMDTSRAADALLKSTYVFLCDKGFRFVARTEGGTAHLYLPGTRRLRFARQSDTLYRGEEGSLRLWIDAAAARRDSATATTPASARAFLTADGTERPGCVNEPAEVPWANAELSGVNFRAAGYVPQDWNLDAYGLDSLLVFVTDEGRARWQIPYPAYEVRPDSQDAFYRATLDGQPFVAHLQGRPCTDAATGLRYPTTLAVTYRGQTHTGCGRELN